MVKGKDMKIRNGFVSNSSSSSFTCDVCGENASGMDMNLHDAEMYSCGKHYWCAAHFDPSNSWNNIDTYEKALDFLEKLKESKYIYEAYKRNLDALSEEEQKDSACIEECIEDIVSDLRYEVPNTFCPVCTFKTITPEIESLFLRWRHDHKDKKQFHQIIRDNFETLDELIKDCKKLGIKR